MSRILHYFINTNGCDGFFSFFKSNFYPLRLSIKLEDYPATLLHTISQRIIQKAERDGFAAEVIHNCLDNTIEGVILPQLGTGFLNIPAYIDYGYSVQKLMDDEGVQQTKEHLVQAHHFFREAKRVHDEWESYYIANTSYGTLNQFTQKMISELLGSHTQNRKGRRVHRFFGAATEDGAVDYVQNLTAEIDKQYFIKGRPGTGKSTFLKKVADRAVNNGFTAEVYHCAFDPSSLDMVIVRELRMALFDSTAPHEYFPEREQDEILDFYEIGVKDDTDALYAEQLADCAARYRAQMGQAKLEIAAANQIRLEREGLMYRKVNETKATAIIEKIEKKLFSKEDLL